MPTKSYFYLAYIVLFSRFIVHVYVEHRYKMIIIPSVNTKMNGISCTCWFSVVPIKNSKIQIKPRLRILYAGHFNI
ncbi:hypothetical protein DWUX_144 [Desulfovibrio diazotrophicus]|nr:hypothetical protein DWUX_144 [Desulfovibrio diazotrophicus]